MPWAARLMDLVLPGRGLGLRLPSPFLRYVTFKLTLDLSELPALQSLVRRSMQALMSGDGSEWDLAMQMPHYNSTSMPAVSLHTGAHFGQWARDPAFRLFDHGSAAANRAVYAAPRPPSIAHNYRLLDVPVDLVAGTSDRVVGVEDVKVRGRGGEVFERGGGAVQRKRASQSCHSEYFCKQSHMPFFAAPLWGNSTMLHLKPHLAQLQRTSGEGGVRPVSTG